MPKKSSHHNNGGSINRFLASQSCGPSGWLAPPLIKVGDVETNPGPRTTHTHIWICDIWHKQIHVWKQMSIRCTRFKQSAKHNIKIPGLPSTQRIRAHNSHIHTNTPPLQTLVQTLYSLTTYTTAIPTGTHVQLSP